MQALLLAWRLRKSLPLLMTGVILRDRLCLSPSLLLSKYGV